MLAPGAASSPCGANLVPVIDEEANPEPIAREGQYIAPAHRLEAFHCALCGVLSTHDWNQLYGGGGYIPGWMVTCTNCAGTTYWFRSRDSGGDMRMADPLVGGGPRPHIDMPAGVRRDYEEARTIVMQSPRGAGALLRLAAQKLVNDLVPGNADLNAKTATLVAQGLPEIVAQALDVLRVAGNNAVHPAKWFSMMMLRRSVRCSGSST